MRRTCTSMSTSRAHLPSPSSPLTPPPSPPPSPPRRIAVARARLQYHKQSVSAPPMGAASHHPPHLRRHRWQRSMSQDSSFSDTRRKVSPFNYSCYYTVLRVYCVHSLHLHQLGVHPQQGVTHCLLREAVPCLLWQRLRNDHLKPHLLLMRRRG